MLMKVETIQFVERGKAEFRKTDFDTELAPGEILLKTICTLISPGTEFDCLNGNTNRGSVIYPVTLGYSAVGTVLKCAPDVTGFAPGDRCLCYHSSHRSYQKLPAAKVVKIEYPELASE